MAAPYNNLRSKLNRAIAAYLISSGCGSIGDIYADESTFENFYPNTTVTAKLSRPDSPFTGNRRITVYVSIKGSAVLADGETDTTQPRVQFDARVALTMDALLQTDDNQTLRFTAAAITAAGQALAVDKSNGVDPAQAQFAQDNADMADFTCLSWFENGEGDGEADAEACSWEEILMFDAIACASAIT